MLRKLGMVVIALGIFALAGWGYWQLTTLDRIVKTAQQGFGWKDDDTQYIAAHPRDPRSAKAAVLKLHNTATDCGNGWRPEKMLDADHAIFTAQPLPSTDASAQDIAFLVAKCNDPRAKTWAKLDDALLLRAIRKTLYENPEYLWNPGLLIEWLEERHTPVSDDLLVAISFALGMDKEANTLFIVGFPPNAAPFGPAATQATRVAVAEDPRMPAVLAAAIARYNHYTPTDASLPPLHELTRRIKVPVSDDVMLGIIRMGSHPGALEVAADVLTAADLPRLRELASEDWSRARVGAIAVRLGGASADDIKAVLDQARLFTELHKDPSEQELQAEVAVIVQRLKPFGAAAVPALVRALESKDPTLAAVAVEALHDLDPTHFAELVGVAAEHGALRPLQLKRAITMSGTTPDPRLYFGLMATPGWASEAVTTLQKTLPAPVVTRALFAHLAQGSQFSIGEIGAYQKLLTGPECAPIVAASLEDALTAAGGQPARVYWLAKIVGLGALRDSGTPKERATVAKFSADNSAYQDEHITYDQRTGKELKKESQTKYITWLAKETLDAIDARSK